VVCAGLGMCVCIVRAFRVFTCVCNEHVRGCVCLCVCVCVLGVFFISGILCGL